MIPLLCRGIQKQWEIWASGIVAKPSIFQEVLTTNALKISHFTDLIYSRNTWGSMGIYAIDRTVCYSILNWGFPTSGSLQGSQVQADCIRGGFTCLVLKYLTGPDLILNQQLWQWLQCKEYVWKSLLHNNHPGQKKSFVLKTETTSSENKSLRRIHQCEKDQTVHTSADLGHVQIIAWNQFRV